MTPEPYIKGTALKYFERLASILDDRGQADEAYSIELSILSQEYAKYEEAQEMAEEINPKTDEPYGWFNIFANGTVQVNAYMTMSEKALSSIKTLSGKFGFTPKDFAALGLDKKEPEKKSKLQILRDMKKSGS